MSTDQLAAFDEEYERMYALLKDFGADDNGARKDALTWASAVAPYEGMKSTDCASGCCYNALKDECENDECFCHTYDSANVESPF